MAILWLLLGRTIRYGSANILCPGALNARTPPPLRHLKIHSVYPAAKLVANLAWLALTPPELSWAPVQDHTGPSGPCWGGLTGSLRLWGVSIAGGSSGAAGAQRWVLEEWDTFPTLKNAALLSTICHSLWKWQALLRVTFRTRHKLGILNSSRFPQPEAQRPLGATQDFLVGLQLSHPVSSASLLPQIFI